MKLVPALAVVVGVTACLLATTSPEEVTTGVAHARGAVGAVQGSGPAAP